LPFFLHLFLIFSSIQLFPCLVDVSHDDGVLSGSLEDLHGGLSDYIVGCVDILSGLAPFTTPSSASSFRRTSAGFNIFLPSAPHNCLPVDFAVLPLFVLLFRRRQ